MLVKVGEGLLDRLARKSHVLQDAEAEGLVKTAAAVPDEAAVFALAEVTRFGSAETGAKLPPPWVFRPHGRQTLRYQLSFLRS